MVKYDKHDDQWKEALSSSGEFKKVADSWLRTDNFDYQRHHRIRSVVKPIIEFNKDASWLTIGDGRYGSDAAWLMRNGASNVHASDLSDRLLKIAAEKKFICDYSQQNAEDIKFADNSFDYVFCKEAFHHFPRPFLALEEMMRVSKKGVIIIEPRDDIIDRAPLSFIFDMLRRVYGHRPNGVGFEEVGNFIYSISERELEKFQLGMHRTSIAYKGLNDSYVPGIEHIDSVQKDFKATKLRLRYKMKIFLLNCLTRIGVIKGGNLLIAVLFNEDPSDNLIRMLIDTKFEIKSLPRNPYV